MPRYMIVPSTGGGAVLQILCDDLKKDKQVLTFGPVDEVDAIAEAMAFAERYEAVHSLS